MSGAVCVKFADGLTEWRFDAIPLPQPPPVPLQSTVPPWLADSFRAVERAQLTVRSALDSVEHLALKLDKMRGQTTEEEPWKRAECEALREWPALWRRQATFRSLVAECSELSEGNRLSRRARDDRTEGGTMALAAASGESASLTYGEVRTWGQFLQTSYLKEREREKYFIFFCMAFRSNRLYSFWCSCGMCSCA